MEGESPTLNKEDCHLFQYFKVFNKDHRSGLVSNARGRSRKTPRASTEKLTSKAQNVLWVIDITFPNLILAGLLSWRIAILLKIHRLRGVYKVLFLFNGLCVWSMFLNKTFNISQAKLSFLWLLAIKLL